MQAQEGIALQNAYVAEGQNPGDGSRAVDPFAVKLGIVRADRGNAMKRIWTIIGVSDVPGSFKWYQSLFRPARDASEPRRLWSDPG